MSLKRVPNWRPEYIVVHHSASNRDSTKLKDIDKWHKGRGWTMCGYNYVIEADGNVAEGRPEGTELAHCPGYNRNSIAICLTGNFQVEEPTDEQLASLDSMIEAIKDKYPNATVVGHRDLSATLCPGEYLYNYIQELKDEYNG